MSLPSSYNPRDSTRSWASYYADRERETAVPQGRTIDHKPDLPARPTSSLTPTGISDGSSVIPSQLAQVDSVAPDALFLGKTFCLESLKSHGCNGAFNDCFKKIKTLGGSLSRNPHYANIIVVFHAQARLSFEEDDYDFLKPRDGAWTWRQLAAQFGSNKRPVVKYDWILACVAQNKLVSTERYEVRPNPRPPRPPFRLRTSLPPEAPFGTPESRCAPPRQPSTTLNAANSERLKESQPTTCETFQQFQLVDKYTPVMPSRYHSASEAVVPQMPPTPISETSPSREDGPLLQPDKTEVLQPDETEAGERKPSVSDIGESDRPIIDLTLDGHDEFQPGSDSDTMSTELSEWEPEAQSKTALKSERIPRRRKVERRGVPKPPSKIRNSQAVIKTLNGSRQTRTAPVISFSSISQTTEAKHFFKYPFGLPMTFHIFPDDPLLVRTDVLKFTVERAGGALASIEEATFLITSRSTMNDLPLAASAAFRRAASSSNRHIVDESWIDACVKENRVIDLGPHVISMEESEQEEAIDGEQGSEYQDSVPEWPLKNKRRRIDEVEPEDQQAFEIMQAYFEKRLRKKNGKKVSRAKIISDLQRLEPDVTGVSWDRFFQKYRDLFEEVVPDLKRYRRSSRLDWTYEE